MYARLRDGGTYLMTSKRPDKRMRSRAVVLCVAGLSILLAVAACGPLGDEEEEPTATAGPSIPGPTSGASPASTPVTGTAAGTPASELDSNATPNPDLPNGSPEPLAPSDDDATPVPDGASEATPDTAADATPEADTPVDAVVDSCDPDEIPPFEGDNPNFVVTTDLNFRQGPGQDCDPIGDAPLGEGREVIVLSEPVTREGEDQEWVQVEVDGEPGWVAAEFIEPAE
jgi:hypothetical protein